MQQTQSPAPLRTFYGDRPGTDAALIGAPAPLVQAPQPVPTVAEQIPSLLEALGVTAPRRNAPAASTRTPEEDRAYQQFLHEQALASALRSGGITDPARFAPREAHGTADIAALSGILPAGAGSAKQQEASRKAYDALPLAGLYQEMHPVGPNGANLEPTGNVRRKLQASHDHGASDPVVSGGGLGDMVNAAGDEIAHTGRALLQIPLGAANALGVGHDAAVRNARALLADSAAAGRDSGLGSLAGGLGAGVGGAAAGAAAGGAVGGFPGAAIGAGLGGMGLQSAGDAMARGIIAGHGPGENLAEGALAGGLGTAVGSLTGGAGSAAARAVSAGARRAGLDGLEALLGRVSPRAANVAGGAVALPAANTAAQAIGNTIDPDAIPAPDTSIASILTQAGLGAFAGYIHPNGGASPDLAAGVEGAAAEARPEGPNPTPPGTPPGEPPQEPYTPNFTMPGEEGAAGPRETPPGAGTGMRPPPAEAEPMGRYPAGAGIRQEPIDAEFQDILGLGRPSEPVPARASPLDAEPEMGVGSPRPQPVQDAQAAEMQLEQQRLIGEQRLIEQQRQIAQQRLLGGPTEPSAPVGPVIPSMPPPEPPAATADGIMASIGQQTPQTGAGAGMGYDPVYIPIRDNMAPEVPGAQPQTAPIPPTPAAPAASGVSPEELAAAPIPSGGATTARDIQTRQAAIERTYPGAAQRIYQALHDAGAAAPDLDPRRPLRGVNPQALAAMLDHPEAAIAHVARVEKALRSPAYARLHPELKRAAAAMRLMPRRSLRTVADGGRQQSALPFEQVLGAHAEMELDRRGRLTPEESQADSLENERVRFEDCERRGI